MWRDSTAAIKHVGCGEREPRRFRWVRHNEGMNDDGRRAAAQKMRAAGAHPEAIRAFESAYGRLVTGHEAMLPTAELEAAGDVPDLDHLPPADPAQALADVAVIKLNGGLATSMGLQEPKSLVQARAGRSFLEIIVGQTLALRERHQVRLPLVLMNSEATRAATERALAALPAIAHEGIAPDFMQSMIPKLDGDSLAPVSWPAAPDWSGARPGTETCTARCGARACSRPCSSRAFGTR